MWAQVERSFGTMAPMENDPLATYLDALARDDCYRVERVLKASAHETTEVVYFVGANEAELGPFVRKRISGQVPLGGAYAMLWEAQRAGRRFRHVPRIYDVHERDDDLVVVMEYVADRTLREVVYERDASVDLARALFPALCDGVSELHEGFAVPLIHRDLKPSNIVVNDGGLTIIDFGIARPFRAGAETDTAHFGTRSYAPPEQFGYGQTDERSDGYALGMLLYYLVTERDPSPAVATGGFAGPEVPACLRPVLQRACAFDPADRFPSVRALKAAFLQAVGAGGGEGAPPATPCATAATMAGGVSPMTGAVPPTATASGVPAAPVVPAVSAGGSPVPAGAPVAPFGSGKLWAARSITAVALWMLFLAAGATLPFDPGEAVAHWPLFLRMAYYWTFTPMFTTGLAGLVMGDGLFARLFARFGLNSKKRQRLFGWVLIGASVLMVWLVTSVAGALGFEARSA